MISLIPSIPAKASQIDATQKIHKLYEGYYYDFIPDESIPSGYEFNSEVLDYVISRGADFLNAWITQKYGKCINFVVNTAAQQLFSLCRSVAISLGLLNFLIYDQDSYIYKWSFECTGIEQTDTQYGTKYGFLFTGMFGETFSLVLNENGNIWGSEAIGNYTASAAQEEIINQIAPSYDPNEIYIPTYQSYSFGDLKAPYFVGKELNFFYYFNNIEHHVQISDFTECFIISKSFGTNVGTEYDFGGFMIVPKNPQQSISMYIDGNLQSLSTFNARIYSNLHGDYTGLGYNLNLYNWLPNSTSMNLPGYYGLGSTSGNYTTYVYDYIRNGMLDSKIVAGNGDLWLSKISTTPTSTPANPNPVPIETPIPTSEIPSDPEDPIPQNPTPDPVPGIPINPVIPLPPFATIVSGNDDLWGSTLEYDDAQEALLPYLNNLFQFEFPSFEGILTDFLGSLIWVAQIMSLLYNGTSFNILFICLALFSLVTVLIGGYKLWTTSESDPNYPGLRRSKKPPKGGKRH